MHFSQTHMGTSRRKFWTYVYVLGLFNTCLITAASVSRNKYIAVFKGLKSKMMRFSNACFFFFFSFSIFLLSV